VALQARDDVNIEQRTFTT